MKKRDVLKSLSGFETVGVPPPIARIANIVFMEYTPHRTQMQIGIGLQRNW